VLLADDGLQHYRLARDFEIAVLDERGAGNGFLLPAGPLREGVTRLAGVDAVVINGDAAPALPAGAAPVYRMRLAGERFQRLAAPQQRCGADELRGMPLRAVAGIGNPQRFFDHLSQLGLAFRAGAFPDHHAYRAEDLTVAPGEQLLMTEKDAVKCAPMAPADTWVLPVDAVVVPDLAAAVVERIRGFATA
jgi:tetraacyldisaccharide 4'-kinase